MIRRLIGSLALGAGTLALIGGIRSLPYSHARTMITDALSMPGGLVAALFFPEGLHSAHGGSAWPWVALLGNLAFYALVWFLLLGLYVRARRTRSSAP